MGGEGPIQVEEWEYGTQSTKYISNITHRNRLYATSTVLPANVCSNVRNN